MPTQRCRWHVAVLWLRRLCWSQELCRPTSRGLTRLEPCAQLWERSAAAEFLRAYYETAQGAAFMPPGNIDFRKLLDIFLLDKALYEVLYELNSRPAWVRIPLMGIILLAP